MNWYHYLMGLTGLGAVGLGALALFAPGILAIATEFLKPVAKTAGEFVAWFFKDIVLEGIKDIFDNLATLLLVILLMGGTFWYTNNFGPKRSAAEKEIVKLVDQIKCMRAKRCK